MKKYLILLLIGLSFLTNMIKIYFSVVIVLSLLLVYFSKIIGAILSGYCLYKIYRLKNEKN